MNEIKNILASSKNKIIVLRFFLTKNKARKLANQSRFNGHIFILGCQTEDIKYISEECTKMKVSLSEK